MARFVSSGRWKSSSRAKRRRTIRSLSLSFRRIRWTVHSARNIADERKRSKMRRMGFENRSIRAGTKTAGHFDALIYVFRNFFERIRAQSALDTKVRTLGSISHRCQNIKSLPHLGSPLCVACSSQLVGRWVNDELHFVPY